MRTIAIAFASMSMIWSAVGFAAAPVTSGGPEVVSFQADLFTGHCARTPNGPVCQMPATYGRMMDVVMNATPDPDQTLGSVFLHTSSDGFDFDTQINVHHFRSTGHYDLEVIYTSTGLDVYGRLVRETRTLANVDVTSMAELNAIQLVGSTIGNPDRWMWATVGLAAPGRAFPTPTAATP